MCKHHAKTLCSCSKSDERACCGRMAHQCPGLIQEAKALSRPAGGLQADCHRAYSVAPSCGTAVSLLPGSPVVFQTHPVDQGWISYMKVAQNVPSPRVCIGLVRAAFDAAGSASVLLCSSCIWGTCMLLQCFAWGLTVSSTYTLTPVPSLVYSYLPSKGRLAWSIVSKSQGAASCVCRVLIRVTGLPSTAAALVAFAAVLELATVPAEGTVELVSAA